MKLVATLSTLVLATASGALWHRLTVPQALVQIVEKSPLEVHRAQAASPAGQVADELLDQDGDNVLREEMLASLAAEQFPALGEELLRRGGNLNGIVSFWAEIDAKGLLDFAHRSDAKVEKRLLVVACFRKEPDRVLAMIHRWKEAGTDQKTLDEFLDAVFRNIGDPAATLAAAEKFGMLEEEKYHDHIREIVREWAKQDPEAAVAFGKSHGDCLDVALHVWSREQPEAALSWLRGHAGNEIDTIQADSMLSNMAENRPQMADQLLALAENKTEIYEGLARTMHGRPVEELVDWIDALPKEGQRAAYEHFCSSLRYKDPRKGASIYLSFPELATPHLAEGSILEWSKRNPVGVIEDYQAGKIPANIADKILPQMVESWRLVDRTAAIAFVNAQPPSEVKGLMLVEASRILEEGDADAARDFAMSLPEPATQLGACRKILEQSFSSRPDTERAAWIATIPDETIRLMLLTPAPKEEQFSEGSSPAESSTGAQPDPFAP